jgi:hypothetical protein
MLVGVLVYLFDSDGKRTGPMFMCFGIPFVTLTAGRLLWVIREWRMTHCMGCGYSLAGLPAGSVCPECGRHRPWHDHATRRSLPADDEPSPGIVVPASREESTADRMT